MEKIIFTERILKEVSDELGVDIKKVEYVYENLKIYIHHLANETSCLAIFLPKLGTMYISSRFINKKIKMLEKACKSKDKLKVFLKKKERLDSFREEAYRKFKKVHPFKKFRLRHDMIRGIDNRRLTKNMKLYKLEEIQNKYINENSE